MGSPPRGDLSASFDGFVVSAAESDAADAAEPEGAAADADADADEELSSANAGAAVVAAIAIHAATSASAAIMANMKDLFASRFDSMFTPLSCFPAHRPYYMSLEYEANLSRTCSGTFPFP